MLERDEQPAQPARTNARIRHVKGIDGVRGLAVLSVVFYHFWPEFLPGGFLGVDIFFVLSGFLITSLLLREGAVTGRISLTAFWKRRARRILPAAVFVLLVCAFVAGLVKSDATVGLGTQFFSTLFFVNNWAQIANSQSYFSDQGVQVFAHYWSLAVEEQFYVIWPLLVLLITWIARKRWPTMLWRVTVIGAVLSAILMGLLFTPGEDPSRVYYGTDTHLFGLLIGATLALLLTNRSPEAEDSYPQPSVLARWLAVPYGLAALIALFFAFFVLEADSTAAFRGGIFTASIATAVLIYSLISDASPLTPLFNNPLMRWFGDRSFSLYLWHWPVIVFLRTLFPDSHAFLLGGFALALSLLLAALSYEFIENPFRRRGYREMAKQWILWPIVIILAFGAVFGVRNAPTQTALEAELSRKQEELKKSDEEDAPRKVDPSDTTKLPVDQRTMPKGEDITAIGDSVMLASALSMQERFPGIHIDAEVSRHLVAGLEELRQLKSKGQLRDFVVMGFGTNGSAWEGQMEELLKIVGPKRTLVLITPYGERDWIPQSQADVLDLREEPNVYIAPWCRDAKANPTSLLGEDGIHPTEAGAKVYTKSITNALQQWVDGEQDPIKSCS